MAVVVLVDLEVYAVFSPGFLGAGDPLILDMELAVEEDLTLLDEAKPSLELAGTEPCLDVPCAVVRGARATGKSG